jgi:phosphoenolpyruvate carboxylase
MPSILEADEGSALAESIHGTRPWTAATLDRLLATFQARAATDPFSNPVILFAIELTRRLENGTLNLDGLDDVVGELTAEAFKHRADRLSVYLGEAAPAMNRATIRAHINRLARDHDFHGFRGIVERPVAGVVFTAHPTFTMSLEIARSLSELACHETRDGNPLSEADCSARIAYARATQHRPPEDLTIELEQAWSHEALTHAHTALRELNRIILEVAREHWPTRWTELNPNLITLASWVGYDQDGRTDVTSLRSFGVRIADKQAALKVYRSLLLGIKARAPTGLTAELETAEQMLDRALEVLAQQVEALRLAERHPRRLADFSRNMVEGRSAALVDLAPLVKVLNTLQNQMTDDTQRTEVVVLRSLIEAHGATLAHVHVRLNASQLHNAIRYKVGLETNPNDVSNRRWYLHTINDLLDGVSPCTINFAALMAEQTSARRLIMTVAQMLKLIDSATPIRFLIAETKSGFTLLTALYFARLFGIDRQIEISPLFETEEAFERGHRVIEEALRSRHYRDYLTSLGRLAIQFGYSDSGRFVGQLAASFKIERLRLRLAQLLERHGLGSVEVILFNTHGESLGRGNHPRTLLDRLAYLVPGPNRREFAKRGIKVKEEVSFQGGDGFLPFLTPSGALAVISRMIDFTFGDAEAEGEDPIYSAPDYAAEFFATIQQEFARMVDDPDYATLLGLFGVRLLYPSGSRPAAREGETGARSTSITHPSQLRAIPNNAVLQQIGFLANTLYGVGRAVARDPDMFAVMRERSPRFRRAFDLVNAALEFSDLNVTRAYAHTFDSGLWLINAGRARSLAHKKALRELAKTTENIGQFDRLARVIRRLQGDYFLLTESVSPSESDRRGRILLLHGLRIAVIQRVVFLSMSIPDFAPQQGVTRDEILARIAALDVPYAVERLQQIFPSRNSTVSRESDFGEYSDYRPEAASSYANEHHRVFSPIMRLYEMARSIGSALNHEFGAIG